MSSFDAVTAALVTALLAVAAITWSADMNQTVKEDARVAVAHLVVHNIQVAHAGGGQEGAEELLRRVAAESAGTEIRVCDVSAGTAAASCAVEVTLTHTAVTATTTDNDGQPVTATGRFTE